MDNELHPSRLVEETLGDDTLLRGHRAKDADALRYVCAGLLRRLAGDPELVEEPPLAGALAETGVYLLAKVRNLVGELDGPAGSLSQP